MVHLPCLNICYGLRGLPFHTEERLGLGDVARVLARVLDVLPKLAVQWSRVPVVVGRV